MIQSIGPGKQFPVLFSKKECKTMKKYELFTSLLEEPHVLIAGATGSGKSVIINGMIYTIMLDTPKNKQVILVDPKKVELCIYKNIPHCIYYACEKESMFNALKFAMDICNERFSYMQKHNQRMYTGTDIYVFIDEFADLMNTDRKRTQPLIQRLSQIGRAARVHTCIATQTPISRIVTTEIKCNYIARVALRTACEQDSRNIIGNTDCMLLPKYGQCFYKKSMSCDRWIVPYYTDDEINELIKHWERCKKKKKLFPWILK